MKLKPGMRVYSRLATDCDSDKKFYYVERAVVLAVTSNMVIMQECREDMKEGEELTEYAAKIKDVFILHDGPDTTTADILTHVARTGDR